MEGWICVHRSLISHWVWQDPLTLKAWIDLLMMANIKDSKALINGKLTTIKRGQCMASIRQLSIRWECSREKARKIISNFEADNMITLSRISNQKNDKARPLITINNYKAFQDISEDKKAINLTIDQTSGWTSETAKVLTSELAYNNKDNNINKDNKERGELPPVSVKRFKTGRYENVFLSPEEAAKLQKEFPTEASQMIEKLSEYMETTGKKYQSHYAVIAKWIREDRIKKAEEKPKKDKGYMERTQTDDDIKALELKKLREWREA